MFTACLFVCPSLASDILSDGEIRARAQGVDENSQSLSCGSNFRAHGCEENCDKDPGEICMHEKALCQQIVSFNLHFDEHNTLIIGICM